MTHFQQDMATLHQLFQPWATAPNGTVIWEPLAADPNGKFKQDIIAKAIEVIAAGDAAAVGAAFRVPRFGDAELEAIEHTLDSDAEQRDFIELGAVCRRVSVFLARNKA